MTLFLPFLFGVQATATGARTSGSAVGDDSVNVLILYGELLSLIPLSEEHTTHNILLTTSDFPFSPLFSPFFRD